MSKDTHTPGPWVVYPETDGTEINAVDMVSGLPVRQRIASPFRGKNWVANARLIAAAPDLLEALKKLAAYGDAEMDATVSLPWEDVAEALAAISKAQGTQS